MKFGLIIAGADIDNKSELVNYSRKAGYIICADRGYSQIHSINIIPDMVIGDFDSIESKISNNIKKKRFPSKKNETDLELAILELIEKDYKNIVVFGALYGRIDHTYANIRLMEFYFKKNINITLIGVDDRIYITDNDFKIGYMKSYYISLFSLSDKTRIKYTKGLEYSLNDDVLIKEYPLGISNTIIEKECEIKIKSGVLLIILSKNNPFRMKN